MKDLLTFRQRADARNGHPSGRSGWRRRLGWVGIASVLVMAALVVIASLVALPYEAITPGSTVKVSGLISISRLAPSTKTGSVSLVDVNLVPLSALNFLFFRLNPDNQIVAKGQILGTSSQATYDEQGALDMASAQQAATYVAFQQLGYAVHARQVGVAVYEVEPGSPAAIGSSKNELAVGDIIQQVGGSSISDVVSLRNALSRYRVDEPVALTIQHLGRPARHDVVIRLGVLRTNVAGGEFCLPDSKAMHPSIRASTGTPCLGVALMPLYRVVNQPFAVNINALGIIGPSAGLAFALGLIQALDRLDLTHGLSIAATGTLAMNGSVGAVGGVRQKTIAVRDSGASVFFVPTSEFDAAKASAGPNLRVFPVASISQALRDLESLGGRIFKRVPR